MEALLISGVGALLGITVAVSIPVPHRIPFPVDLIARSNREHIVQAQADGAIAGVTQAAAFCEVRAWAEDQRRIVRRELQLDVVGGNDQAIRATIMPSKDP